MRQPGDEKPPKRKPRSRLTAAEQVERDAKIVVDKALGLTYKQIAAKYHVSEKTAYTVFANWRDSSMEAFNRQDALELGYDMIARYEAIEAQAAQTATTADNDSAKIGALRLLLDTTSRRLTLMQATGKMPRNLGVLRHEFDVRHVAQVLVTIFKKYELPEEAQAEVKELLRSSAALN